MKGYANESEDGIELFGGGIRSGCSIGFNRYFVTTCNVLQKSMITEMAIE